MSYLISFLATLAALAGVPAAAAAGGGQFTLGSADPAYLTADSEAEREELFDATAELGAGVVRLNAVWFRMAPTSEPGAWDPRDPADPNYEWADLDAAVRAAAARGLEPVITIQKAPPWAEGPGKPDDVIGGVWDPDPDALADFTHAIVSRYSGSFSDLPRVRYWQAWNEGNLIRFLAPQYEDGKLTSPDRFRALVNRIYDEIKAVSETNQVIIGGTAPLESRVPVRVGPTRFLRKLFCLNGKLKPLACPDKIKFDIFDHHAIAPRKPTKPGEGDGVRLVDYSELTEILRAAERAKTILPAGIRRPLWTTEIYWETNPPDTATGVPPKRAAQWTQEGVKLLYEQDLDVVLYFFIRDLPYAGPGIIGNVQGGLLFNDLTPKPSYTAFGFPLTGERTSKKKVELFARAPVGGKLKIQVERKAKKGGKRKKWKNLLKKRVKSGQVVLKKAKLRKKKGSKYKLRAKLPGRTSLIYKLK